MTSCWPCFRTLASVTLFAQRTASTLTPCLRAIEYMVSPARTVYVFGVTGGVVAAAGAGAASLAGAVVVAAAGASAADASLAGGSPPPPSDPGAAATSDVDDASTAKTAR